MVVQGTLDHLEERLADAMGRERAELLCELAWNVRTSEPERGLELVSEVEQLGAPHPHVTVVKAACSLELESRRMDSSIELLIDQCRHLESRWRARAYRTLGRANYLCAQLAEAERWFQRGLDEAYKVDVVDEMSSIWNDLGNVRYRLGRYPEAFKSYSRSLVHGQEANDAVAQSVASANLGNVYSQLGLFQPSLEMYQASLKIQREVGDDLRIASTLQNLGVLMNKLSRHEDAIVYFRESIDLLGSDVGKPGGGVAYVYAAKSDAHFGLDDPRAALRCAQRSLEIAQQTDDPVAVTQAWVSIGHIHSVLGDLELAEDSIRRAEEMLDRVDAPRATARVFLARAELASRCNRHADAIATVKRTLRRAQSIGDLVFLDRAEAAASRIYEKAGMSVEALEHHRRTVELRRDLYRKEDDGQIRLLCAAHRLDHSRHQKRALQRQCEDLTRTVGESAEQIETSEQRRTGEVQLRKGLELEIEELAGSLGRAQTMETVGQLASSLVHEFNNILTVILAKASLLRRAADADNYVELSQRAAQIERAAERGASLTRQLLTLGRGGAQEFEAVDVNRLVVESSEILKSVGGERIHLELDLASGVPRVFAHSHQLEQVLAHCTSNARDAIEQEGVITVSTHVEDLDAAGGGTPTPGRYVVLRVTDTGRGMCPETLASVFKPFFTTKPEGTGLGLASVRWMVERFGGVVCAESEPGVGSTFSVYLPVAT